MYECDLAATCSGDFVHTILDLSASLDCGDLGAGEWSGTASPLSGRFELAGALGEIEVGLFGSMIIFFLIVGPQGFARLWQITKEKLRLWPFPY